MFGQGSAADRFCRERVAINRDVKFAAEHVESANVIAMFVGEEDAIELVRSDSALREAQDKLARAQSAVDQQPAMIGRDERAVSRAPAPEHRQTKHCSISNGRAFSSQMEMRELKAARVLTVPAR